MKTHAAAAGRLEWFFPPSFRVVNPPLSLSHTISRRELSFGSTRGIILSLSFAGFRFPHSLSLSLLYGASGFERVDGRSSSSICSTHLFSSIVFPFSSSKRRMTRLLSAKPSCCCRHFSARNMSVGRSIAATATTTTIGDVCNLVSL